MPEPVFRRYELGDRLGSGSYGAVYRARHRGLDKEVAIKILAPEYAKDDEVRTRFLAEGQRLARLHHPNIVAVLDADEEQGYYFLVMELVQGETLVEWAKDPAHRTLAAVASVLVPLGAAVDALHAQQLVHRDIKPENVMREPSGRVVLMDLGISRALDEDGLTLRPTILGTPSGMAPEQWRLEPVGPAADIYAL